MKRLIYLLILTPTLCLALSAVPYIFPRLIRTADAVAISEQAEGILLPSSAVTASDSVFVFENGRAKEYYVRTEQLSDDTVRLLAGISAPQWVLIGDGLKDGEYVKIQKATAPEEFSGAVALLFCIYAPNSDASARPPR